MADNLPAPTSGGEISDLKRRVTNLERLLSVASRPVAPTVVVFVPNDGTDGPPPLPQ